MGSKKKVGARVKIALCCSECKRKNYTTMKNKKNTADKMEIKKLIECAIEAQKKQAYPHTNTPAYAEC